MTASTLSSNINRKSPDFEKNSRRIVELLTQIKNEEQTIREGGGAKAIESQHKKGRSTMSWCAAFNWARILLWCTPEREGKAERIRQLEQSSRA